MDSLSNKKVSEDIIVSNEHGVSETSFDDESDVIISETNDFYTDELDSLS